MTKVLITGATGNVGREVLSALQKMDHPLDLYAGVRDIHADRAAFANDALKLLRFDFTNFDSNVLNGFDVLFLLRPPQLSEVEKYFKPIIDACVAKNVKHIVFLSVQGVEKSKIIPHHKIERLIVESKIPFTFLRPAYFMQNFTTTLHTDLVKRRTIFLPAGKAKFALIDVRDIGIVSANILVDTSKHVNKSYELTGREKLTFLEMAQILSNNLGFQMQYRSPNLINFFLTKRREGVPAALILVMIMLHYLPRFQREPELTDWVEKLAHKEPTTFDQFVKEHKRLISE